SRRRHTICLSDWSSDVCSSDLTRVVLPWSTWAMMAILRMLEFKSQLPFPKRGLAQLYHHFTMYAASKVAQCVPSVVVGASRPTAVSNPGIAEIGKVTNRAGETPAHQPAGRRRYKIRSGLLSAPCRR